MSKAAPSGTTVLAFDYGEKRVGVAVGDLAVRIAHALTTISAEDKSTRFTEIATLVAEWRPARFVVGLPAHADGTEHATSRLARRFAHRLEGRFGIPVTLVNERLTSHAAEMKLSEAGVRADRRKAIIDAAAAREILQSFFESSASHP